MDLLVFNGSFTPLGLIDDYESLIWTDRYYQAGDFELVVYPTESNLNLLQKNRYIYLKESEHWMIVEGLEITTDVENGNRINVTGRSLESILDRRIVWNLTTFEGSLQDLVRRLLMENAISPAISDRKISRLHFSPSTDPRITRIKIEKAEYIGDTLYDIISSLCEENRIGFKITVDDDYQFQFTLYSGDDRSYDQTSLPYVTFSPNFENIINSNYQRNIENLKNVSLIGGEGEGAKRRFNTEGSASGLSRREVFTDAAGTSSDKDDHFDPENYTAYPFYINPSTKKFGRTFSNRLLYFPIEPNGEYSVSRSMPEDSNLKYHMYLATSPNAPVNGGAITDLVADPEKTTDRGDIVAGSGDHYLAVQLFTNDDSIFDKDDFTSYALSINTSTNKFVTASTKRLLYVPITPGGTYTAKRADSIDHLLILATCTSVPANGVSITNVSYSSTQKTTGTITAGPNDKYLAVQLFADSESAFDPEDYSVSNIKINTSTKTIETSLNPRMIQISCDKGGTYTVSRSSSDYHLVLGTNVSGSSEGDKVNVVVTGTNRATITGDTEDKTLFVQLYTDADNMFQVSSYAENQYLKLSIDTENLRLISAFSSRLVYIPITAGVEYKVTRKIDFSYSMTLATCRTLPASGLAITSFTTEDTIRAGASDGYLLIQLFNDDDSRFNTNSYESYALSINTSTKVISNSASDRLVYVPCLPSHTYTITRSTEMRYTMVLATASSVPVHGGSVNVVKTYKRGIDDNSDETTITSGASDNYLIVQLFNDADYNNGATISKAIKSLSLKGTADYTTAREGLEVFKSNILEEAVAGLSIPGGEAVIASKDLELKGTATLETAIKDLKVTGPMLNADYMEILRKKGEETLLDHKEVNEFESEIDMNIMYKYGEDFFMGDRVQIENEYGITGVALITELVRNQDTSGNTAYPAFVLIE